MSDISSDSDGGLGRRPKAGKANAKGRRRVKSDISSDSESFELVQDCKGEPLQLVSFMEEEGDDDDDCSSLTLKLNEDVLDTVIKSTKGRPLCIFNICGNARSGKSHLMNYVKRCLECMENEETDWMDWSNKGKPLQGGFSWKHGYKPDTKGIWIWSEAFLLDGEDDEIAVLLLDTQGFSEEFTSREEIESLLGLSMLSSSVTILNFASELPDKILSSLATYLKYGLYAIENDVDLTEEENSTPFQHLSFLIRDWGNPGQHGFGAAGGKTYLEEKMQARKASATGRKGKVEKMIRDGLRKCFKNVDCFLLPYIGEKALLQTYNGCVEDLSSGFAKYLETFINSLTSSDNLAVKRVIGGDVTGLDFKLYLQAYVKFFNGVNGGEEELTPETLWDVTVKIAHENAVKKAIAKYHEVFEKQGKGQAYLQKELINSIHIKAKKQALVLFKKCKTLEEYRAEYVKRLEKELKQNLEKIKEKNENGRKTFIAECIRKASELYRDEMNSKITFGSDKEEFYEEACILQISKEAGQQATEEFSSNFDSEDDGEEEDEEKTMNNLVRSLHEVLQSVLDSILKRNSENREKARGMMEAELVKLVKEYNQSMKKFLVRNPNVELQILSHYHDITKDSVMEKFDNSKKSAGGIDFQQKFRLQLDAMIKEAYEQMDTVQQSKMEEQQLEAEKLLREQSDTYFQILKEKVVETGSDDKLLRMYHQQASQSIVERFEQKNPFNKESSRWNSLNNRLQQQLVSTFQRVVEEEIVTKKKLQSAMKTGQESSWKLYKDGIRVIKESADFLEEEDLNELHTNNYNQALAKFDELVKDVPPEDIQEKRKFLEEKFAKEFECLKRENEQNRTLAHSQTKNLVTEYVKEYEERMGSPIENCSGQEELTLAHISAVSKVVEAFEKKLGKKSDKFKEEYTTKLVEEMEETFDEIKNIFEGRRADEENVVKEVLHNARKYYHDEMEKHFKNQQFITPPELHAMHERATNVAIKRCEAKKPLKESQKQKLNEKLKASFQKYKEKNDMMLNWDMEGEPAIGIDLGTTYCCVAVFYRGRVTIIRNQLGANTTPSYVAFNEDGSQTIGQPAKDNAYKSPESTIFDAKRIIGRKLGDDQLQEDMKFWPFEVVEEGNVPKIKIKEKTYYPEQISAILLRALRDEAEAFLNKPVNKAVITVPAYFNDGQRQATVDAGEMAGLEVLTILNEPTAAAIAYKLERFDEDARKVLIFDLGGGTFDVAVLETDGQKITVLAVDGDTHLGGEDFDKSLMEYCAKQFEAQVGNGLDLFKSKDSKVKQERDDARMRLRRLQTYCERSKKELASARSSDVSVDAFYDGKDLCVTVTRAKFEELNAPHFTKTIEVVKKVLTSAGLRKDEIDDIVLVGGSTRIPKVQEMLSNYFGGKALNRTINPDEAVGYGAAVQAALMNGEQAKKLFNFTSIQDVTPMSIGVEVVGGELDVIIPKNTKIPTKMKQLYRTFRDNQTSAMIKIYEGENLAVAQQNTLLGEFTLEGIPPARAGKECIDIVMTKDAMGILHVEGIIKSTLGSQSLTVKEEKHRLTKDVKKRILAEVNAGAKASASSAAS